MSYQMMLLTELIGTVGAGERALPSMGPHMLLQVLLLCGPVGAVGAGVGPLTTVCAHVQLKVFLETSRVRTNAAVEYARVKATVLSPASVGQEMGHTVAARSVRWGDMATEK